jgi:hypothetical protein
MVVNIQNTFASGEFAPELYARADSENYKSGVAYLNNFLISDRGPITRRPPTYRFGDVWNHALTYRFVPFTLNLNTQLLLVFASDDTMRIINIATRAWVESSPGTPFSLSMAGTMNSATKVQGFNYAQSGKVLFLVRADIAPLRLVRASNTNWSLASHDYVDGPYDPINTTGIGLIANNATGSLATVIGSTAPVFVASDIGRLIRIGPPNFGEWVVYKITGLTNSQTVTVVYQIGTGNPSYTNPTVVGNATKAWRLGSFWDGNYPSTVAVYEDRLVYGGTPALPETVFVGTTSGFDLSRGVFSPTSFNNNSISDAEGFTRAPANDSRGAGTIQWLSASKDLILGSTSGVYSLTPRGQQAFGPLTAGVYRISDTRSADVKPYVDNSNILLVEAGGRRPLRLSPKQDSIDTVITANEASFFSPHLFYNDVVLEITKTSYPYSLIIFRMASGKLLQMAYSSEASAASATLVGIMRGTLGGRYQAGDASATQAKNLFSVVSNTDETWLLVNRTLTSGNKQQIEFMIGQTALSNEALVHLDAQTSNGWVGLVPTSAPHYAGQAIRIVIDGADYGTVEVDGAGNFTLPRVPTVSLTLGYGYVSEVWTLPPVQASQAGIPIGRPISVGRVDVQVLRSIDIESGRVDLSAQSPTPTYVNFRRSILGSQNVTERPELYTGVIQLPTTSGGGAKELPGVALKTNSSYPLNIVSLRLEYNVQET